LILSPGIKTQLNPKPEEAIRLPLWYLEHVIGWLAQSIQNPITLELKLSEKHKKYYLKQNTL
jgi:hypothetical protein